MALVDQDQDFLAAVDEIESNTSVRRLMLVLVNLLVPGLFLAATDCLTGSSYPPELIWLPNHMLSILGGVLLVSGILIGSILVRCHFGMVVNGNKIHQVLHGSLGHSGLNWSGVSTNFVALTALSASLGIGVLAIAHELGWFGVVGMTGVVTLFAFGLIWNHRRAVALARRLTERGYWERRDVSRKAREEHAVRSLNDVQQDIGAIVALAPALFVGLFSTLAQFGGLEAQLFDRTALDWIQRSGAAALGLYLIAALGLSLRMVVRLRLAIGQHSIVLADLRSESDDPYRFKWSERTFLLYLTATLFFVLSVALALAALGYSSAVLPVSSAVAVVTVAYYALTLRVARRRQAA